MASVESMERNERWIKMEKSMKKLGEEKKIEEMIRKKRLEKIEWNEKGWMCWLVGLFG